MRFIVAVGWSIYPLGYLFGYLQGAIHDDTLNLIYNPADFVNKIAFTLAIWSSARNMLLPEGATYMCSLNISDDAHGGLVQIAERWK